jgi:hypothetical protein
MSGENGRGLPARLEGVRRRFERWRRTREIGTRIPDSLWASAVKVAGRHGIHRTAKALRVDYYSLKKRVEEEAACSRRLSEGGSVPTFVELACPAQAGCGECLVELEDAGGAKMRVQLKGIEAPDLVALSRSFWGVE